MTTESKLVGRSRRSASDFEKEGRRRSELYDLSRITSSEAEVPRRLELHLTNREPRGISGRPARRYGPALALRRTARFFGRFPHHGRREQPQHRPGVGSRHPVSKGGVKPAALLPRTWRLVSGQCREGIDMRYSQCFHTDMLTLSFSENLRISSQTERTDTFRR